jgi:hypothetical protein
MNESGQQEQFMRRISVPFLITDISAFARSLASEIELQKTPSHLQLLNMLARAGGQKNYQQLLATAAAKARVEEASLPQTLPDFQRVETALRCFNAEGQMVLWPAKRQTQELCLWPLWAALPPFGKIMDEKEVNQQLNRVHTYGDAALLRRELWGAGFVSRDQDCSNYQRLEIAPTPEARELIRRVTERRKAHASVPLKQGG